jgi:hypothetical protein
MTKASNLADIPAPAGATHVVDDWYDVDSPDAARYFTGGEWVVTEPTPNTPTSPCKSTAPSRQRPGCGSSGSWKTAQSCSSDDQRSSPFSR